MVLEKGSTRPFTHPHSPPPKLQSWQTFFFYQLKFYLEMTYILYYKDFLSHFFDQKKPKEALMSFSRNCNNFGLLVTNQLFT